MNKDHHHPISLNGMPTGWSLRRTLFLYFSLLVGALGILTTIIGIRQINVNVFGEAQDRVRSNCTIGRALFDGEIERIRDALRLSAQFGEPAAALRLGESRQALAALTRVRIESDMDFLSLTDSNGVVRLRTVPPMRTGDSKVANEMIVRALEGEEIAGVSILTREELEAEGDGLADRAFTVIEQTPMAEPIPSRTLESGMAMMAAVPVRAPDSRVIGVFYGGKLLNRNFELVDWLRRMAFGDEKFGDRYVGTVTLFQGSVRIATNVMRDDGTRAFGTVISSQVGNHVLNNGKTWFGRAFVVNHWHLSNYQPIRDIRNRIIGVFYMGILEKKYVAIRNKAIGALCSVTLLGMFAALIISYLLAYSLSTPLYRLARAARRISAGTLGETVQPEGHCAEVLDLTDAFNQMSKEIAEKQAILASTNAALEKANRNYLEMLGFITHEFKGPIASCVTNVYTLSHELVGPLNPKQHAILASISRSLRYFEDMVRNYLELSRIETGELVARKQCVHILRDVVRPSLDGLMVQMEGRMTAEVDIGEHVTAEVDPTLMRIVFDNLLSNAIKYGRDGGKIRVYCESENALLKFHVWNEGRGIEREDIGNLFEKFSRLEDIEQQRHPGTGLGLFITKRIVEEHGGRIWVESEPGQWADFVFEVPKEGGGNRYEAESTSGG